MTPKKQVALLTLLAIAMAILAYWLIVIPLADKLTECPAIHMKLGIINKTIEKDTLYTKIKCVKADSEYNITGVKLLTSSSFTEWQEVQPIECKLGDQIQFTVKAEEEFTEGMLVIRASNGGCEREIALRIKEE